MNKPAPFDLTVCSIDGCAKKHYARGFCNAHYKAWYRYGSPIVSRKATRMQCAVPECQKTAYGFSYCQTHYRRFKDHGDPLKGRRFNGTGSIMVSGYHETRKNGTRKLTHILIAEHAIGKPLPKGAEVHHADKNPLNNDPHNLVICPSNAYHKLLHQRMRALAACGNANWRKCRHCQKWDAPENIRGVGHVLCLRAYSNHRYAERKRCQPSV